MLFLSLSLTQTPKMFFQDGFLKIYHIWAADIIVTYSHSTTNNFYHFLREKFLFFLSGIEEPEAASKFLQKCFDLLNSSCGCNF